MTKKYRQLDERELLLLDGPVSQRTDGDKLTMIDVIPATVDVSGEAEDMVFVREALLSLTPQEQRVVKATILDGFTEREAAKKLGISQPVVHRAKKRALKKFAELFFLDKMNYLLINLN